ncbi:MAG: delta 1-pyrroline-5-carboxylate synthetase [Candidatus Bathyarchaeia archaeon]
MTLNIVKVGGSLSKNPEALRKLCQKLSLIAQNHPILVVPGGGKFADCVREADKHFSLSAKVTHRMAILGMDQYGLLLSDLIPNCQVAESLEEAKSACVGRLVVFLPSRFMFSDDGLPNSWQVTSDSIAAYIAGKLGAEKLLLIKDVDGLYTCDPKQNPNAQLLKHLTVSELLGTKTCVDDYLPKLLKKSGIDCFVVNGFYPDRVEAVLKGQTALCTLVSP